MGQKINPYGFRLGVSTDWKSRWFSEREYQKYLTEDWKIRQAIMSKLESAMVVPPSVRLPGAPGDS